MSTKTLKTKVVSYKYDIGNEAGRVAYNAMCERLTASGVECMKANRSGSCSGKGFQLATKEQWKSGDCYTIESDVYLCTKHLMDNQWNTTDNSPALPNCRVFDWAEDVWPNLSIKAGHYTVQTKAMKDIQRTTLKCGYCGQLYPKGGDDFCGACLGSEYLTEKDLHRLRLLPIVNSFNGKRPKLTDKEKADLLPAFTKAQIHGNTERDKVRIAVNRAAILASRDKTIRDAHAEFDGLTWLMDNGIKTENFIYYKHLGRWCFGWRSEGVDKATADAMRAALVEFPYAIDYKEA